MYRMTLIFRGKLLQFFVTIVTIFCNNFSQTNQKKSGFPKFVTINCNNYYKIPKLMKICRIILVTYCMRFKNYIIKRLLTVGSFHHHRPSEILYLQLVDTSPPYLLGRLYKECTSGTCEFLVEISGPSQH